MLLVPDSSKHSGFMPWALILLIIAAIVLVSIACYFLIEVPARRALRPRSKPSMSGAGFRPPLVGVNGGSILAQPDLNRPSAF